MILKTFELIEQINEELKRLWGRPLCANGLKFLNENAYKLESVYSDVQVFHKKPSEELLNEWRKRNEMTRQYGFDFYIDLPERRQKLEQIWKERDEEAKNYPTRRASNAQT